MSSKSSYLNPDNPKEILKKYLSDDFSDDFVSRKKQGFVFDVESWVFNNIEYIEDKITNGYVVNKLNNKIINLLSFKKSRINGQRIWKLFVLEYYLARVFSKSWKNKLIDLSSEFVSLTLRYAFLLIVFISSSFW